MFIQPRCDGASVGTMDIDRSNPEHRKHTEKRVSYCLDKLEESEFKAGVGWHTEVCENLTVEELIGALVSAEQEMPDDEGVHNDE